MLLGAARQDADRARRQGPRGDHAHLVHLLPARAAGMGAAGLGHQPRDAAKDLLGRSQAAGGRGPDGRFLLQRLRQTLRSRQYAGGRGADRLVQLLLAHAVSQGRADRGRQPGHEADQPALLQHRLDQEGDDAGGHALFPRPVPAGISAGKRQGLRASRHEGEGALRRHGAVGADAEPELVRRGGREDPDRRRAKTVDLGHRHRRLLSASLGAEQDLYAVFRHALLRSELSADRQPHLLLPLAPGRSDRFSEGDQSDVRALRLDVG